MIASDCKQFKNVKSDQNFQGCSMMLSSVASVENWNDLAEL